MYNLNFAAPLKVPPGADRPLAMPLVRCKVYIYVKRFVIIAMKDSFFLACKTCKHTFCFRILLIDVILQKTLYAMNLYNFQENLFLFSRNFTIWIGLQLVSQSDSFQALGSCFCEKYNLTIFLKFTLVIFYAFLHFIKLDS